MGPACRVSIITSVCILGTGFRAVCVCIRSWLGWRFVRVGPWVRPGVRYTYAPGSGVGRSFGQTWVDHKSNWIPIPTRPTPNSGATNRTRPTPNARAARTHNDPNPRFNWRPNRSRASPTKPRGSRTNPTRARSLWFSSYGLVSVQFGLRLVMGLVGVAVWRVRVGRSGVCQGWVRFGSGLYLGWVGLGLRQVAPWFELGSGGAWFPRFR